MSLILNDNNTDLNTDKIQKTEEEIQFCFTNLKILSKIIPKDKIYCKDGVFVIHRKRAYLGLSRYINSESRIETIKHLEEFTSRLFSVIDKIYNAECETDNLSNNYYSTYDSKPEVFKLENSKLLISFTNEIEKAICGLGNLKLTYKKDISTVSSLEIIIEKLSIRQKKISEILQVNSASLSLDNKKKSKLNTN